MKKNSIIKKSLLATALFSGVVLSTTACTLENLFVFPSGLDETELIEQGLESFAGCKNSIFLALYNYYGFEGQNFTNRWLGMMDALNNHGILVDNWAAQKDATQFKLTRTENCDLPKDANIYMVNNQEWDAGVQFTRPIAAYKPMAIISTCNGVEFAAAPIKSSGISISNATLGGFSKDYREAFENGTLKFLESKYAAHVLPIVAAGVDAVVNGAAMKNDDGTALAIPVENWPIQTLAEYNKMDAVDSIDPAAPALRYCNIKQFFEKGTSDYGAAKLSEWTAAQTKESVTVLQQENATNAESDTPRTGDKIKVGLLKPSAVNDQVKKYVDYVKGYCAQVFNYEVVEQSVSGTNDQVKATDALIASKVNLIISFQDDTNRVKSIKNANKAKIFFAVGGAALTDSDYNDVKKLPYYVGSVGTPVEADRKATREMTEYYLGCMIARAKGQEELYKYQREVKGLVEEEVED